MFYKLDQRKSKNAHIHSKSRKQIFISIKELSFIIQVISGSQII